MSVRDSQVIITSQQLSQDPALADMLARKLDQIRSMPRVEDVDIDVTPANGGEMVVTVGGDYSGESMGVVVSIATSLGCVVSDPMTGDQITTAAEAIAEFRDDELMRAATPKPRLTKNIRLVVELLEGCFDDTFSVVTKRDRVVWYAYAPSVRIVEAEYSYTNDVGDAGFTMTAGEVSAEAWWQMKQRSPDLVTDHIDQVRQMPIELHGRYTNLGPLKVGSGGSMWANRDSKAFPQLVKWLSSTGGNNQKPRHK